ncbi:MAG: hypothetical protein ACJ73S_16735 [Mycobacteriales bacterium]|jgi:hypothetical protein
MTTYHAAKFNPFEGVTPDFQTFLSAGNIFKSALAILWAGALCYLAAKLILAGAKMANARRHGYANSVEDALGEVKWVVAALIIVVGSPLIFVATTALVG